MCVCVSLSHSSTRHRTSARGNGRKGVSWRDCRCSTTNRYGLPRSPRCTPLPLAFPPDRTRFKKYTTGLFHCAVRFIVSGTQGKYGFLLYSKLGPPSESIFALRRSLAPVWCCVPQCVFTCVFTQGFTFVHKRWSGRLFEQCKVRTVGSRRLGGRLVWGGCASQRE